MPGEGPVNDPTAARALRARVPTFGRAPLRAREAARLAGISKNTLLRWLKQGKVPEVARDRNGWRIFRPEDVARIRDYAHKTTPPEAPFAGGLYHRGSGPAASQGQVSEEAA